MRIELLNFVRMGLASVLMAEPRMTKRNMYPRDLVNHYSNTNSHHLHRPRSKNDVISPVAQTLLPVLLKRVVT